MIPTSTNNFFDSQPIDLQANKHALYMAISSNGNYNWIPTGRIAIFGTVNTILELKDHKVATPLFSMMLMFSIMIT